MEQCPTSCQEAQEESHAGPGRDHPSRGLRRAGGGRQGGAHPVLGPVGPDACRGVARRGGDRAGGRALRPPRMRRWAGAVMAATPGRSAWRASACRFACPGFAMSRGARCRCGRMRRLHGERAVNDLLLTRVLYGISCRNYEAAAEAIPGAIGLSGSTVSRTFIQASATKLRELQERGPVRGGRRGDGAGREDVRRVDDGRRAGDHVDGGENGSWGSSRRTRRTRRY